MSLNYNLENSYFYGSMKLIHQIANVLLALLLLVSTTGVTLHKHYCMGEVKDIAINHHAQSCTGNMDMEMEMGCCEDTIDLYKADDFQKANSVFELDILKVPAVLSYILIDLDLLSVSNHFAKYLNYKPPLIDLDIPILVQSFLI